MTEKDFHNEFNTSIDNKLDSLVRELHQLYIRKNYLRDIINSYADYYGSLEISIDVINRIDNTSRIHLDPKKAIYLNKVQYSYIKSYNYIVGERIKLIEKELRILSCLSDIPFTFYYFIQDTLNVEITNFILKGNQYNLGNTLGIIKIGKYPRKYFSFNALDWGETNKQKKLLLSKSVPLFSRDNPTGTKYFIFFDSDTYYKFYWRKVSCKIINKDYYNFKVVRNGNIPYEYFINSTDEEILNNRQLGGIDKLAFLIKNNSELIKKYGQ